MKNWNKTQKTDFSFLTSGFGRYKVTYTSPATRKRWTAHITDMELIDRTKNEDFPKRKDLEELKRTVKRLADEC